MMRSASVVVAMAFAASTWVIAQRSAAPAAAAPKVSTAAKCGAELGTGVKTHRRFCDVVISRDASAGVVIAIPPHTGAATLQFDLHNRFTIPAADANPGQAFMRQMAVVAVIRSSGAIVGRAAVINEFRTVADLFDQLGGAVGGAAKVVAPGQAEHIEIAIPAGLSSVSIVGLSLEATSRAGTDVFDAPGRPVAIVSNWRVEYR